MKYDEFLSLSREIAEALQKENGINTLTTKKWEYQEAFYYSQSVLITLIAARKRGVDVNAVLDTRGLLGLRTQDMSENTRKNILTRKEVVIDSEKK